MYRHLPKLLWTLAFLACMFVMVKGFSLKTKNGLPTADTQTESHSGTSMQSGLNIKNLSHHLLDFNR